MDDSRRITLAQQNVARDVASNLATIHDTVGRALAHSPDLIILPEYSLSGTPDAIPAHDPARHARMIEAGMEEIVRLSHTSGMALIVPTLHYTDRWGNSSAFEQRTEVFLRGLRELSDAIGPK